MSCTTPPRDWPPRLRPDQAQAFAGLTRTQLKRLRARREIRFFKTSARSVAYCRDSLAAWLAARTVEALGGGR